MRQDPHNPEKKRVTIETRKGGSRIFDPKGKLIESSIEEEVRPKKVKEEKAHD